MGANSSTRSTHFQRPEAAEDDLDVEEEPHHISISNKMVERLVEDATLTAAPCRPTYHPEEELREKIFVEKLKCMDDNHSKKWGLSVEELDALATRIDKRTSNMVQPETVCSFCEEQILQCYEAVGISGDPSLCWESIETFKRCVREAANQKISERARRDARALARRSRNVARAREDVLKDLAPASETYEEAVAA